MEYEAFVRCVADALHTGSASDGARTARAVLVPLSERLEPWQVVQVASELPREVDRYMVQADSGQQFTFDAYLERVAMRSLSPEPDVLYQAQIVMSLVEDTVPAETFRQLRAWVPQEYRKLFVLVHRDMTETV